MVGIAARCHQLCARLDVTVQDGHVERCHAECILGLVNLAAGLDEQIEDARAPVIDLFDFVVVSRWPGLVLAVSRYVRPGSGRVALWHFLALATAAGQKAAEST